MLQGSPSFTPAKAEEEDLVFLDDVNTNSEKKEIGLSTVSPSKIETVETGSMSMDLGVRLPIALSPRDEDDRESV